MRRLLLNIICTLTLLAPSFAYGTASAAAGCPGGNSSKGQVLAGIGETGNNCDPSGVNKALSAIVSILSIVIGAVAVIMIMVAGFKYITSGGDTNAVANAKSTLIYALVGLAIAALAQLIVHFVLYHANKVAS